MVHGMSRSRKVKKSAKKAVRAAGRARQFGDDPFGIQREAKIHRSNVRTVFTPHQPVSEAELLFGRQDELRRLVETLNTPGQHVLLYGERGVGKSSLANVATMVMGITTGRKVVVKRCDRSDTFATILQAPLKLVGADLTLAEVSTAESSTASGGVTTPYGSASREKAQEVARTYRATGGISPSTVAEAIGDLDVLLLIDEADAISKTDDRGQLAELIKLLSDSGSRMKIMVVGIAQTGSELTAAHPSVQRCLKETKLRRMTDAELKEIITAGASAVSLVFKSDVVDAIVRLSAGYPHFTHLIALKCAEEAVVADRHEVRLADLKAALELAVEDAEGTLKRVYNDSVRSASEMYRHIVAAAATLPGEEFGAAALRSAIEARTGEGISQGSLNNYFSQRLVSNDGSTIFRRTGQGHYRFEDPRMSSYVRMVNGML
jgi:Cdc6-like AAA superfamily ATPase